MDEKSRASVIEMGWKIHDIVEASCLDLPADAQLERQRLLLADMAIHLLQTAVAPGDIELARLRDNLHAILMLSDKFLPLAGLKQATAKLY